MRATLLPTALNTALRAVATRSDGRQTKHPSRADGRDGHHGHAGQTRPAERHRHLLLDALRSYRAQVDRHLPDGQIARRSDGQILETTRHGCNRAVDFANLDMESVVVDDRNELGLYAVTTLRGHGTRPLRRWPLPDAIVRTARSPTPSSPRAGLGAGAEDLALLPWAARAAPRKDARARYSPAIRRRSASRSHPNSGG